MPRFWIGMMLAMIVMVLASASASAQSYPCPNGPGPGERQIGTAGGGNSGLASFPICERADDQQQSGSPALQFYWVDNFVVVAWHPDASDVWAVSRARSVEEGKKGALALCEAAMKDGCTIANAGSNGSIAIARSSDGLLWSGWGATPKKAKEDVLALCLKKGARCVYEKAFTGKPWEQLAGTTPPFRLVQYLPPPGTPLRNRYGALAWAGGSDAPWDTTVWVSGGFDAVEEAEKVSIAQCEKDSQLKCKIGQWNSNGFIILYRDAQNSLFAGSGLSKSDAEKGSKEACKKAKRKCETLAVFDVRQPGLVTKNFPNRSVAK